MEVNLNKNILPVGTNFYFDTLSQKIGTVGESSPTFIKIGNVSEHHGSAFLMIDGRSPKVPPEAITSLVRWYTEFNKGFK